MSNFVIKSSSRGSSYSVGKFNYTLKRQINSASIVKIHLFQTINGIYNVNQYNSVFTLTVGVSTYTITIANGYYSSATALSTAVAAALNAAGSAVTFSCSVSTLTLIMTITGTGAYSVTLGARCSALLGISSGAADGSFNVVGTTQISLLYCSTIKLVIPEFRIDTEIPISFASTSMISYSNSFLNVCDQPFVNIQSINIRTEDEFDNPWTSDFVLQLEVA
jgi:hypothetical protein